MGLTLTSEIGWFGVLRFWGLRVKYREKEVKKFL